MDFEIRVSKKAQKEIENALDFYCEINIKLGHKFLLAIEETYLKISKNPYYQIRYKNYRATTINKFPFLLFYTIEENTNSIKILSCFHTSKSTKKYPK
ncbi:type II toxin-antitoxin system RelE/ParE family toxin [Flavobacterium oreochromis]|uniref:type II toxin-antitoxin system RelE/ParE family toxin n=1 Tax=Flavobacterium oreochromis TaxID=2906078 RepID=UPI000CDAC124|nr:hypothetical protein BWK58_12005 [Flavobacterium columnare]